MEEEEKLRTMQEEAMELPDLNIAVSGIAGRFPKSGSVNEFEDNLYRGIDMVNDQDESRFTCGLWGLPPRAGRLKELDRFDGNFFGFSLEEANYIDFQLRILYEVVYESILDAGVNPASLRGSRTGVFFGLHCNEFENAMADDPAFKSSGYYAQFAVKVAQYFDFRGITVTFDAACASGFVGLHNAVEALKDGIIEQAVVCSSNIPIHPTGSFIFLQMQMLSPTGYSRFLDSRADGYVKSEACVSVLLQRKHLALRNYASIMSTMTSVDGYKPEGITFPSDKSQERLIRAAKDSARIHVDHVQYLEAHGTGTPAGDPQEARAISSVYCRQDERRVGPLLVGSVKTNMGHSEAASGLCALAKVVLMLENELIYKSLHFEQPNANIESLKEGKIKFVDETVKLDGKIVPLSCYGFGGSNVHAILRANHKPAIDSSRPMVICRSEPRLVVMFGRTEEALNKFFDHLLDTSSRQTRNCLSEDFLALVDSLNSSGKIDRLMEYRGYIILEASNHRELARSIRKCSLALALDCRNLDRGRPTHFQEGKTRACNLVFSGLGSEWPEMAAGLVDYEPFWSTIRRLSAHLGAFEFDVNLVEALTGPRDKRMQATFIAIVAYQIALINIVRDQLKTANLRNFVGHSLGQVSCAYAAGIFDEREAILVAYHLGRALDQNRNSIEGGMVVVALDEYEISRKIVHYHTIRISCINGPQSTTVSGKEAEIQSLCSRLTQDGIMFKVIDCDLALHNDHIMNADIQSKLEQSLIGALSPHGDYTASKSKWIPSFVDDNVGFTQANAAYFAASLCKRVDFLQALDQLDEESITLELGPSGIFESQLMTVESKHFHYVKLMRASTLVEAQTQTLIESLGRLYQAGAIFDLTYFYHGEKKNQLFPVRRGTPSLSSIFYWDHQHSLFVPRYPVHFSKSSAKCEMPVDIVQERDKYLTGHCIEGRVLYPATGYLFLIWRIFSFTKRRIYDACFQDLEQELIPIEFHNVRLLRAIILGNRVAQIYVHFEEGTGRFEIKEGGSVVAEGYARLPSELPHGLLYERVKDHIKAENLELSMNADDIYKQFRVSGYDYGETFRNIISSSADGRYCKVKYNGHFVAFTDSILQSIFLAVSQYAPSGGLFLPTKFEYARFQPEIILEKIHQCKMVFDKADGSLNTKAKREIMTKIMQRESGDLNAEPDTESVSKANETTEIALPECIFETYCDPITGVILTDGIEMRGIKATPAPRRFDNNEVLLESYQFVCDIEEPIRDEPLTKSEQVIKPYCRACDAMSVELLCKLNNNQPVATYLNGYANFEFNNPQLEDIKAKLLESRLAVDGDKYDINKNRQHTLMSVLDQAIFTVEKMGPKKGLRELRQILLDNKKYLLNDLIQRAYKCERFMRPIVEVVLENVCLKKMKLKILEMNLDDALMKESICHLIKNIEPSISLDYSLAHPNLQRLSELKLLPAQGQHFRTYPLQEKDLGSIFNSEQQQLRNLNFIIYKDISCYSLPKQVIEKNGVAPVLTTLAGGVQNGGFILVLIRERLTLAESVLLALGEPELVGLSKRELELIRSGKSISSVASRIAHINDILAARCKLMLDEAERNNMLLLAKKSDENGCCALLLKVNLQHMEEPLNYKPIEKTLIRLTHSDQESVRGWLETLKSQFAKIESTNEEQIDTDERQVWLCAVATKQNPISGLVGMMQALRKELGPARLRCYYDMFTFKHRIEPVSLSDIENSPRFKLALERDLIWNCVNESGQFGAYRHFTINEYMSYEECRCDSATLSESPASLGAYVNHAHRGDLSSFTWFEGPFKYLSDVERRSLVDVEYSALNFRDVMLATGRLPLDAIPLKLAMSDCQIGLEFSGYDSDGRRVMGMVGSRGLATRLICKETEAIKLEVPDWMSLAEAATIPVVYSTAVMSLIYRGQMRAGESILVHAGSGGVGQAAIRLAIHHGLTVFTTVGSDEKREFLIQEFGPESCPSNPLLPERIYSSRDCRFEEQLMRATGGRGVDLVLNSLADDKLQASVRCLADGGRFLEIGKYDMSVDARLELLQLDSNKTFHGVLLDKIFDLDTEDGDAFKSQLRATLATLREGLEQGYIKPIRSRIFGYQQVEEAFRYMATGKHIGKVLIKTRPQEKAQQTPACVPRFHVSSEKSYLVTGGLGGFGLELVKWLVSQGARRLVISSRSGLRTGYQRATLDRLRSSAGARIRLVDANEADAATRDGARRLVELALEQGQLGGLFHLAMVLKDSLLEKMSAVDFELVCRPKVEVCFNLDAELRASGIEPDYFVAFSSVSCGKGNAGQSNYAYANSCLERICEGRRRDSLHGLAIQWGAIGDVGVAFENLGGNDIIIGGTMPQRMPSCLTTLGRLLSAPFATCLSVVPVNRSADGAGEKGDLVGAIMHVLGIKDPSKVSEQASLGELGLDSLMAVEIRQYIEREYDMTLNIQEIRSLTIAKIREISENGKSAAAALKATSTAPTTAELRQVRGYGSPEEQQEVSLETKIVSAKSDALDSMIDKHAVAAFVPQLELPRDDFRMLNDCKPPSRGRPIFFIPPIHGEFDRLELICANIDRPCIGLNWTRKLGRSRRADEAVEVYLELLSNSAWLAEFHFGDGGRIIDLVGYSYGATIAFELMLALHRNPPSGLKPGRLVLLDGSPRQIELGSQLLGSLTQHKQMKLAQKVDQLIMVYVIAHVRASSAKVDLAELQRVLKESELDRKVELASERLARSLPPKIRSIPLSHRELSSQIAHAMEAFCRRYELISNYRCESSLPGDCTLIRAEKIYLSKQGENSKFQEDLDLSLVVQGKVDLFVMNGDHETFINGNHREIGKIISQ